MKKYSKKLTIVTVLIMYLVGMTLITLGAWKHGFERVNTSNVSVTVPTQKQPEQEEIKVLLVDESGSMKGEKVAPVEYVVMPFSQFLGQEGGNSHICENIERTVKLGHKRIGVFSDLSSWPVEETNCVKERANSNNKYQNLELVFFLTEDAEEAKINDYKKMFSSAMDKDSCTLIFSSPNGSKEIIFDNYGVKDESANEDVVVKVDNTSNDIPFIIVYIIVAVLFTIIMALIVTIIAFGWQEKNTVPSDMADVLQYTTAIDTSASIGSLFSIIVDYCIQLGVKKLYTFAENVQICTIDQVKKMTADGTSTHGWSVLRRLQLDGHKEITIVSDFQFNDQEDTTGLSFESINLVVVGKGNNEVIEKIKNLTNTCNIIYK